jgi:putative SOS response-associated peptidase YedK
VLIRTKDEADQWLEAPPEEALQLQKPAPDDAIVLLPEARNAASSKR